MRRKRARESAIRVVGIRAYHYLFEEPHVFADPIARRLMTDAEWEEALSLRAKYSEAGHGAPEEEARRERYLRRQGGSLVLARARYCEECLEQAVALGVRQYVILGAGLDSFAFRRSDLLDRLTVYEVDLPAAQALKHERLAMAGLAIPGELRFAPCDFEADDVAGVLSKAGYRRDESGFFSWLGVTYYLTLEAIEATLRSVRGLMAPGCELALDYLHSSVYEGVREHKGKVERRRTPLDNLAATVKSLGFDVVEELSPDAMTARYFRDRLDGMRPAPIWRLALLRAS